MVKIMQQVSNIFGTLETIKKKHSRKASVYKSLKENKKKLQKVVDFFDIR